MRPLTIRSRLTIWYSLTLLAILLVVGGLSYSLLRTRLLQDLDTSLLTVAEALQSTSPPLVDAGPGPLEQWMREVLGNDLYDKFFQLLDPEGHPGPRSREPQNDRLPLSAEARRNALLGKSTFETVELVPQGTTRLLTIPLLRGGKVVQLVQVGLPLQRTRRTLARYLQTLLLLIPAGVALAALGGAAVARAALKPVDAMSATARRITAEDLAQRVPRRGSGDELDRLADTLNAMLARLEATFAQMRRFAADAAHELRTPLAALKGSMEVTLRAERTPEVYRRVLASNLEDAERLIQLAEDLLLLARATAGLEGPRVPLDLEPILLEALDLGVRLGQQAGVTVRAKELTPLTVRGEEVALRRAVINLVENAVKYTPPGGAVDLSLTRSNGAALITVADTGIGLDPADAERIFEPFVRLDAARARETGGSGLGLAIARSIVTAHGGTISVESAPGSGSRFVIRLEVVERGSRVPRALDEGL
jgi:heavy metal sensor kinase